MNGSVLPEEHVRCSFGCDLLLLFPADEVYQIFVSALSCLNLDDHNRIRTTDVRLLRRVVRDYLPVQDPVLGSVHFQHAQVFPQQFCGIGPQQDQSLHLLPVTGRV